VVQFCLISSSYSYLGIKKKKKKELG